MRIGDWSSDVCSSDLDFCKRFPAECSETAQSGGPVVLDDARWAQLDAVNSDVNRNIHYVADSRTFDRSEYWTLPQGQGDCEDLALEKRRRLNAMGRSEEHTSELQSLMRISYAVFCLKKKKKNEHTHVQHYT